jgi:hypothetical protein
VAPPLVCLSNVYVLGNMPDRRRRMLSICSTSSELGASTALEVGYLGSQSHRLERMFD